MSSPYLSVVSPFYNEAEVLPLFLAELRTVLEELNITYEVILVDDGSVDDSYRVVENVDWPQLKTIRLVHNVGHQVALEAGLEHSNGDMVVTMDSDLQHPPRVIADLLSASDGVDVVYGVRGDRAEDSAFKRATARFYYRLSRSLSGVDIQNHSADFRLMSRSCVDTVVALPERKVFRLLLPALGFTSRTVLFEANPRLVGASKYTLTKMFGLATLSAVQFSRRPLRFVVILGLLASAIALLWILYVAISYFLGKTSVGWPSLMSVVLLIGGLTLFSLGVIGEYVGEIFEMMKRRPAYLIRNERKAIGREN